MKGVTKLLSILSLVPIILILYISILNLEKDTKLKLLTWTTPNTKIGSYIAISGLLGFAYSFAGIKLLSLQRTIFTYKDKSASNIRSGVNNIHQNEYQIDQQEYTKYNERDSYLERDPRDPAPTVSVPFKVISKRSKQNNSIYSDYEQDNRSDFSEEYNNKPNDLKSTVDDWSRPIRDEWLY